MKAAQQKEYEVQMHMHAKQADMDRMQKNIKLKTTLEQLDNSQKMEKQINLNNHFQQVIEYKNKKREDVTKEMKDIDKFIVQKDTTDYAKYLQA